VKAFTKKSLEKIARDRQILVRTAFTSLQQNYSSEKKLNTFNDDKAKSQFVYKLKIRAWRMLVLNFNKDTPRYLSQYLTFADTQRYSSNAHHAFTAKTEEG